MKWINVLWQDPEEGQVYDVWVGSRIIDCTFKNGRFFKTDWCANEREVKGVTHFMPSPERPKD